MIKTKRRTQVDIETHEITVIRTNGERKKLYCENCGEEVASSHVLRPLFRKTEAPAIKSWTQKHLQENEEK